MSGKFLPKNNNIENKIVHIYTDGGCRSTAKKGETIKETDKCAFAFFLKQGGHEKLDGWAGYGKTNNAMEISGLLYALKAMKRTDFPIRAHLDSAYVVNTIEKKWYENWERNGWTKKGGLANAELWKELIYQIRRFPFFEIVKVKGHSDDEYNNLVDEHLNSLMDELETIGGDVILLDKDRFFYHEASDTYWIRKKGSSLNIKAEDVSLSKEFPNFVDFLNNIISNKRLHEYEEMLEPYKKRGM